MGITITDVRVVPGDSAFLLDDGQTAILCDTGFGFTGKELTNNVCGILGERNLDYIFLTHSHYDHVLSACHVKRRYPQAKIVASGYVKTIFSKPSARATMRVLDQSAARKAGVTDYEDLTDELHVDIVVSDGEEIVCGGMTFRVIALPGHTKCSVGFYDAQSRLLLGTETLGVYFGQDTYLPNFLVGYQMSLDSFARDRELDVQSVLIPHYGRVDGDEARAYLAGAEKATIDTAMSIREILAAGGSKEDAFAYFKERFYTERIRPAYPIDAFNLNTSILIDRIEKELVEHD